MRICLRLEVRIPRMAYAETTARPRCTNEAPTAPILTGYDEEHLITYLRLLDAETDGADWTAVARIVLHLDPDREPERARRASKRPTSLAPAG